MKPNPHADKGTSPPPAQLFAVLAVSSLTIMANATIAPSLPGLAEKFSDVPNIETLLGMLLSLPSLTIILTAAIFGVMAEKFGRRPVLLVALCLYGLGGASGLVADGMTQLLIGRVVLGFGVAGTMTIATMLAADLWTGQARMKFMGIQAAVMNIGGILFLIIGGLLAEATWRGAFSLYLLAFPVAAIAALNLKDIDSNGEAKKGPKPKLDWTICIQVGLLGFFTMAMFYLIPTRMPFFLKELGVNSPTLAGISIAAVMLAGIPASLSYQKVGAKLSPIAVFSLGFTLMTVGFVLFTLAQGYAVVLLGSLIVGLGFGLIMPNQNMWLMSAVEPQARGRAAGILTTFVFAGQFAGPVFAGIAAAVTTQRGVFGVFAVALAVMAVVMLLWALRQNGRSSPASAH